MSAQASRTDPAGDPVRVRRLAQLGAATWALTIIYFPVQLIVAWAWPHPYSVIANTISDLGVVTCGRSSPFPGHDVYACSPLHPLMNATFVLVGVATAAGAILTRSQWPRTRLTTTAVAGVALAGVGAVLVGLAPADVSPYPHGIGAVLQLPGVVAPLLLGLALRRTDRRIAWPSIAAGLIGIGGTVLFALRQPAAWFGLLERIALEPLTLWTFAIGTVLLMRLAQRSTAAPTSRR